ncbi:hypothetical protein SAMN04487983_103611 [Streptomyces sp. yr375]|nr:hypothetical protein SAMN04487983_103611 [Streptomyces sp. yr375]
MSEVEFCPLAHSLTRGPIAALATGPMIVWLNGTHGAGKTTTSVFVQQLVPDSPVFDAEKVGETLMFDQLGAWDPDE